MESDPDEGTETGGDEPVVGGERHDMQNEADNDRDTRDEGQNRGGGWETHHGQVKGHFLSEGSVCPVLGVCVSCPMGLCVLS